MYSSFHFVESYMQFSMFNLCVHRVNQTCCVFLQCKEKDYVETETYVYELLSLPAYDDTRVGQNPVHDHFTSGWAGKTG